MNKFCFVIEMPEVAGIEPSGALIKQQPSMLTALSALFSALYLPVLPCVYIPTSTDL